MPETFGPLHNGGPATASGAGTGRGVISGLPGFAASRGPDLEEEFEEDPVEPIRVLVVDDHALFRRGLEIVLEAEEDIEVIGEAGDGAEAVEKAADLLPDIVLMDVRMPKRGGIEACTAIKEVAPSAKIIMLTISDE
ncbi:response regulator, partial [Streptomyces sp. DSM 41493]